MKWEWAFPGCSWQEKICDPGSQLRVQVRSFWAVSGLTPVQWILAHEKRASTSAFFSLSPCPTPSYLNSNPRLMRKGLIRLCFLHVTRVQEIILKIVRYWGILSIFAFYNCFAKELGRRDFSDGVVVTYPVTWEKRQNINQVHPSSLSRSFSLSLFIAHLQINYQNEWLEGAGSRGGRWRKFAHQHSRLGAKMLSENICLFANTIDLSLKARGLQLYITIIKSRLQSIILLKFRLSCAVCRSWGTGGRELKDALFYPRSTPDVNGDHGDVLSDLFNGSSIALSYFTGQRWKA